MKNMIALIVLGTMVFAQTLMANGVSFTGDETTTSILGQLMNEKSGVYNGIVMVSTASGTYKGKIIAKGSQFLVLEMDTRMQTMGGAKNQKIISQQLIAVNTITAIQYEVLR